ncbi:hypothetical protein OESDEN_25262 [Oesophagostomum dentatum]|uniref:Uncharacterized protein n=1 Tax=Oesophagostomum dentatum TaxID=61180 RepID=A0A0B1RVG0_OESDE|nr:hypothetical protein OESDEN_25262 [Oesophagostomum dentatum]
MRILSSIFLKTHKQTLMIFLQSHLLQSFRVSDVDEEDVAASMANEEGVVDSVGDVSSIVKADLIVLGCVVLTKRMVMDVETGEMIRLVLENFMVFQCMNCAYLRCVEY